jgi:hypothetical protein
MLMTHSIGPVIVAASLLFGQMQNFGTDPEEKTRAEKMIAQNERMIAQSKKMVSQNRVAIGIAILALLVSLASLILVFVFHSH